MAHTTPARQLCLSGQLPPHPLVQHRPHGMRRVVGDHVTRMVYHGVRQVAGRPTPAAHLACVPAAARTPALTGTSLTAAALAAALVAARRVPQLPARIRKRSGVGPVEAGFPCCARRHAVHHVVLALVQQHRQVRQQVWEEVLHTLHGVVGHDFAHDRAARRVCAPLRRAHRCARARRVEQRVHHALCVVRVATSDVEHGGNAKLRLDPLHECLSLCVRGRPLARVDRCHDVRRTHVDLLAGRGRRNAHVRGSWAHFRHLLARVCQTVANCNARKCERRRRQPGRRLTPHLQLLCAH
mmetsp:Transcript_34972/g.103606  ORF Transcript_34972/g.103606 Transcript_34972/m.103606 type:complete len:297 (-) Transcript_34972:1301-2191(-)